MTMTKRLWVLIIAVLLLAAPSAEAANALVQKLDVNSAASSASLAITVSSTGAGNLAVVGFQIVQGTATGCTDGTTAFTEVAGVTATGASRTISFWYLLSTNAGKTTITCTRSGAADTDNKIAFFMEFSGCTSCAFDVAAALNGQTGSGNTLAGAPVTTTGTGLVYGVVMETNGTVTTMTGGNTFTFGNSSDWGNADAYKLNTTAATHTPSWESSSASDPYGSATISFKDGGGGGGTPTRGLMMLGAGL